MTPQDKYKRKLEIIQHNLYGVDLEFAVNIARLRLWLSLAVEYDGREPRSRCPTWTSRSSRATAWPRPIPADMGDRSTCSAHDMIPSASR